MNPANYLLFNKRYHGQPLFKNQVELVMELLENPKSEYFNEETSELESKKKFNNLKSYISQLLSSGVSRSLTEKFKNSLRLLIAEKIVDDSESVFLEILSQLSRINNRVDANIETQSRLKVDFNKAKYISFISAKPLEISREFDLPDDSVSTFLIMEILRSFTEPSYKLKSFRLNFPTSTTGELFWKGIKRFVNYYVDKKYNNDYFSRCLMSNYYLPQQIIADCKVSNLREKIVDEILNYFVKRKHILVFINELPIYSTTTIALDPDEPKNANVYAIFEEIAGEQKIVRYSKEDFTLWRLFVWDKIKLQPQALCKPKGAVSDISESDK